jgi:hypothetical protein
MKILFLILTYLFFSNFSLAQDQYSNLKSSQYYFLIDADNKEILAGKNFDERIDNIDNLLLKCRRVIAMLRTNYIDQILSIPKINKYYTMFENILYNLGYELNFIIKKSLIL